MMSVSGFPMQTLLESMTDKMDRNLEILEIVGKFSNKQQFLGSNLGCKKVTFHFSLLSTDSVMDTLNFGRNL